MVRTDIKQNTSFSNHLLQYDCISFETVLEIRRNKNILPTVLGSIFHDNTELVNHSSGQLIKLRK